MVEEAKTPQAAKQVTIEDFPKGVSKRTVPAMFTILETGYLLASLNSTAPNPTSQGIIAVLEQGLLQAKQNE